MIPYPRLNVLFLLSLTLFILCAGCVIKTAKNAKTSAVPSAVPSAEQPETVQQVEQVTDPDDYYIHTVKFPQENISIIARWFTGDGKNWKELAKSNPTIKPNRIRLGDEIKIPRNIMTRQDAMTLEFVEKNQPKTKRKQGKVHSPAPIKPAKAETTPPPVQSAPEPVEEPLLFGPKYPTE
jgi:hypothetical protein